MKCDMAPEALISLFYDECNEKEEKEIRQHLKTCTACQNAYQELRETTDLLGKWKDEIPLKTVFIQDSSSIWQSLKERFRARPASHLAWGISALAVAAVILLFVFNFQAGYQNGNWQISFGKSNLSESQIEARIENALSGWQNQQKAQLVSLIQESEARQRRDFTLTLNEYAEQQELKRRQDLQLVGLGLEGLQKRAEGRYYQTSTLINDLIRMSNTSETQP